MVLLIAEWKSGQGSTHGPNQTITCTHTITPNKYNHGAAHLFSLIPGPSHAHGIPAGLGTCWLLQDWLKVNAEAEYARTRYTCLEISARLASRQYDTVITRGGHDPARFKVSCSRAWLVNLHACTPAWPVCAYGSRICDVHTCSPCDNAVMVACQNKPIHDCPRIVLSCACILRGMLAGLWSPCLVICCCLLLYCVMCIVLLTPRHPAGPSGERMGCRHVGRA